MKKIFTFILLNTIIISLSAQAPSILWQKSLGGSLYDEAESIIEINDGGYIIAGHSQSNDHELSLNNGLADWWIVRINYTGNIIWKKTLGGGANDYLRKIIQTPDGHFLCVGETNSTNGDVTEFINPIDFWVMKIDLSGEVLWKKCFGGNSTDRGTSACLTSDGNYIIAGSAESVAPEVVGNHGNTDFWILKIDTLGNIIWQKTYGGSGHDYLKSIKTTSDGGYVITGNSYSSDGDVSSNNGGLDVWVIKIDNVGQLQWQNNFGGSEHDYSTKIMEDIDGNFVVIGESYSLNLDAAENHSTEGSRDYFVIKVNNQGQKIWSRCYGGSGNEYARAIAQTNSDEYVIIGESYSNDGQAPNNHGSADFWLIKINPDNGDLIWQKTYGSGGHDEPNDMLLTFDNNFVIVGNTYPNQFLGDVTQHYGDDDIWVLKLNNTDCVKNLMLKSDILFGNHDFNSSEKITATSKITDSNSKINYKAGKSIQLNSGFSIKTGGVFEAEIGGCN